MGSLLSIDYVDNFILEKTHQPETELEVKFQFESFNYINK